MLSSSIEMPASLLLATLRQIGAAVSGGSRAARRKSGSEEPGSMALDNTRWHWMAIDGNHSPSLAIACLAI